TGTESFNELTGSPATLNFLDLPRASNSPSGISVTVTTVGGSGQGTASSSALNANDSFTGVDTFYGTGGSDTFVQNGDPIETFYGDGYLSGGSDTLNLTNATSGIGVTFTPDNSCAAGANSGTASVNGEQDTFYCMSTVLTSGTIRFNVAPGQTATLNGGGTGNLVLNCTLVNDPCNGQGVTITMPNGSTAGSVQGDGFSFSFTGMSIVNGTPFNDLFVPGTQNVTINGDGGSDGVSYAGASSAVVVNLSGNSYTVPAGYGVASGTVVPGLTAVGGFGGTVSLNGISNVIGTKNLNDVFIGGSSPGVLQGGSGNDRYILTGGDTSIIAGTGANTLDLSELSGFTTVTLDDNLPQNTGDGILTLVSGNMMTAIASPGGSSLQAGAVNNATLIGGAGNDKLYAGSGSNQTLIGGGGTDILEGGTGNDTLEGGAQPVTFVPGLGSDTLTSSGTGNTLSYAGATGGVNINLTNNNYSVPPGEPYHGTTLAANSATGGYGGTVTLTGAGITTVTGSANADILVAGGGDNISGDGGNDLFVIDGGNNTLTAGSSGSPTFLWEASGSNTIVGNGSSTVDFSQATAGVTVNLQASSATGGFGGSQKLTGILNIVGSNFSDTLVANAANATVTGLNGNDFLQSSQFGNDTLVSDGSGTDTFCAESGQVTPSDRCAVAGTSAAGGDTMTGGTGTNYFFTKNNQIDTITGGPGLNDLVADDPNDDITNPSAFSTT
ncbi:MAG TPA: calcium-binding protein, partial [Acidimicrobiales bacterium]|nr:calcium-binding protein [Acidimicrobiales bacterium]